MRGERNSAVVERVKLTEKVNFQSGRRVWAGEISQINGAESCREVKGNELGLCIHKITFCEIHRQKNLL